ncbi:hypothetical protein N7534_001773 [Penicillium rubens]|nr:hypothetical protein N7534_001773 [Penicillium rubens]
MAQPVCPLGHPSSLSQSHRGEERPPREWAKHVKKLNYTVAKQGIALKTETLVTLDKMEAKRQLLGAEQQSVPA